MAKPAKCSICGQPYYGWGNNAQPVNAGRCCDVCNTTAVIPARLQLLFKRMGKIPEPPEEKVS